MLRHVNLPNKSEKALYLFIVSGQNQEGGAILPSRLHLFKI